MSKKGLGRGFASLIPTDIVEEKFDVTSDSQAGRLVDLPLVEIEPNPEQPRHVFDEEAMQALANSMRERGLLQPIVVTRLGGAKPRYQIVAGERRWRAAKMLNWTTIPAIVRTFDEQKRLELAIIENLQRSDLNMFEIATAYAKLKAEFNLNVDEVCKVLGVKRRYVYLYLNLLRFTSEEREQILDAKLRRSTAFALSELGEADRKKAVQLAIKEKWNTVKARAYVNKLRNQAAGQEQSFAKLKINQSPWVQAFARSENQLNRRYNQYGVRVNIRNHGRTLNFVCDTAEQSRALIEFFEKVKGQPAATGQQTKTVKAAAAGEFAGSYKQLAEQLLAKEQSAPKTPRKRAK